MLSAYDRKQAIISSISVYRPNQISFNHSWIQNETVLNKYDLINSRGFQNVSFKFFLESLNLLFCHSNIVVTSFDQQRILYQIKYYQTFFSCIVVADFIIILSSTTNDAFSTHIESPVLCSFPFNSWKCNTTRHRVYCRKTSCILSDNIISLCYVYWKYYFMYFIVLLFRNTSDHSLGIFLSTDDFRFTYQDRFMSQRKQTQS